MKLGIISDTHGFLDPQIPKLFAGVGHILHAGDLGDAFIAFELGQIAPLTAVLGNTDLGLPFSPTEIIELAARKFLIHHIVNPRAPEEKLRARLAREKPNVVVFGHTHQRFCETIGGILFFNPGYSGKPKLGVERSVAILHCDEKEIRPEFCRCDSSADCADERRLKFQIQICVNPRNLRTKVFPQRHAFHQAWSLAADFFRIAL